MSTKTSEVRKIHGIAGDISLGLTLPKNLANSLGIGKGDYVRISKDGNKVVVEKVT